MLDNEITITIRKRGQLLSVLRCVLPNAQFDGLHRDTVLSLILCGHVRVNGEVVRDHSRMLSCGSKITIMSAVPAKQYVSRGGNKLEPVLHAWNVAVERKIWIDCGASTGGFTDCLLHHGAEKVHAVDVGYNILDYRLRTHPQVVVHERTNIMDMRCNDTEYVPHRAVVDLSFRSLRHAVGHILSLTREKYVLAMCKPQFELAYDNQHVLQKQIPFEGVLTDNTITMQIMLNVLHALSHENAYVHRIIPAGIKGRKGNQEFFLEITNVPLSMHNSSTTYKDMIATALY